MSPTVAEEATPTAATHLASRSGGPGPAGWRLGSAPVRCQSGPGPTGWNLRPGAHIQRIGPRFPITAQPELNYRSTRAQP